MNCREYESLITDYLEDNLSRARRNEIESHFNSCDKCRALSDSEKMVIKKLRALPLEDCPDEILDRVMSILPEKRSSLSRKIHSVFDIDLFGKHGFQMLAGMAVVALIAIMTLFAPLNEQPEKHLNYTSEEIEQAKAGAELALAYFSVYSRETQTALDKINIMEAVSAPVESNLRKAINEIPYI